MRARLALATMLTLAALGRADEGLWNVGMRAQGTIDLEPGQDWFWGPEVAYSNYNLAAHNLQFKAAYLTNRAEAIFRQGVIRQDYYLFTTEWHFRRKRIFDPTLQLDLGYSHYDVENEAIFGDLANNTALVAAQGGLNVNLAQGLYGLYYHLGYNFITPESGLVFPGVFGLGIWMLL